MRRFALYLLIGAVLSAGAYPALSVRGEGVPSSWVITQAGLGNPEVCTDINDEDTDSSQYEIDGSPVRTTPYGQEVSFEIRGEPDVRPGLTVLGSTLASEFSGRTAGGSYVVVCVDIRVPEDRTSVDIKSFTLGDAATGEEMHVDRYATGVNNGVSVESATDLYEDPTNDVYPPFSFYTPSTETYALIYDVPEDWGDLYLSDTGYQFATPTYADGDLDRRWVIPINVTAEDRAEYNGNGQLEIDESANPGAGSNDITTGTVTEFAQPTVITLGLEKWRITFNPVVEVRTSIAGVTPQRGQFLVIWFDQFSTQGEPLPLGNFTLQASTGPGEPFEVQRLSEEGTTALILTEYTWSPDTMSASTEYRTGIAFEVAPEETHFTLQFRGPAGGLGNDYVVDLTFDA